jgi:phosphoribosylglycinamide formyltransferase-1
MRVAVLVSGAGSNLQALIDAEAAGRLAPGRLVLVISSRPDAGALARAERARLPIAVVSPRDHTDRAGFEAALLARLRTADVEAIVLAGFMRVLSPDFVAAFPARILNTHPALCPAFPGLDAPRQALAHGVKLTGCTVHLVDAGVDTGPIVFQAAVPVLPGDDPASLHRRIQLEEHRLLPEAVRALAAGRLRLDGRTVEVD